MKISFWVGIAFFVQTAAIFLLEEGRSRHSVDQMWTFQLIGSALGSIFGCLSFWVLSLFLKVQALEREVSELRRNKAL